MITLNLTPVPNLYRTGDPLIGSMAPFKSHFFYDVYKDVSRISSGVGYGLFSSERIIRGSVICIGGGQVISDRSKIPEGKDYEGVYDKNLYVAPFNYDDLCLNWYLNHSCEPNTKLVGRLAILARDNISAGEELTIDYATVAAGMDTYKMECKCGKLSCRGSVTGKDWRIPELYKKYFEEWPPFIQKLNIAG